jgi:hypothetical protein
MLSFFVGKTIFGKVIGGRASKALVIAGLITLAVAGFFIAKALYDRSVIEQHDANQRADTAIADRKADGNAAVQRRADDARAATESQEIKEAIHEAGPDPAARRRAYYDCIVRIQAARRDGKQPPSC